MLRAFVPFTLCALLLSIFPLVSSASPHQIPLLGNPIDGTLFDGYGIGFDLSPEGGRAAISYANGTVIDIAHVWGSTEYRDTIYKLSKESSQHLAPPYDNMAQPINDMPRQWYRKARKAVGLPASTDVGNIAQTMLLLRAKAALKIDPHMLSAATVVVPDLVALYHEDIVDAFEYLHMREIKSKGPHSFGNRQEVIHHSDALLAGNNMRLCEHYDDRVRCRRELQPISHTSIALCIGLYNNSLIVKNLRFNNAYSQSYGFTPEPMYPELGYGNQHNFPDVSHYWAAVKDHLAVRGPPYLKQYGEPYVMLYGDAKAVADEDFRKILSEYLREQDVTIMPNIYENMPETVIARGAAIFARQYDSRR